MHHNQHILLRNRHESLSTSRPAVMIRRVMSRNLPAKVKARRRNHPERLESRRFLLLNLEIPINGQYTNTTTRVKRSLELSDSMQEYKSKPEPSASTSYSMFDPSVPSTSKAYHEELEDKTDDDQEVVVCAKCGEKVSAWLMPEHLDYHIAKELQEQDQRERSSLNRADEPPRKKHKASGKINLFFSSNNTR